MSLPEFTCSGELPLGVHRATLREVLTRFGSGPPQRVAIGERLERIHCLACETGKLARFVVFGSFVTDKPDPNDLDVFLVMDDSFDGAALDAEQTVLFDHAAADAHFGASVFGIRCAIQRSDRANYLFYSVFATSTGLLFICFDTPSDTFVMAGRPLLTVSRERRWAGGADAAASHRSKMLR